MYAPEDRDLVTFDKFACFEKSVEQFKKIFKTFGDSENQFLGTIIYGVMFHKSDGEIIDKNKMIQVLGEDFYNDLLEVKDEIKLDRTLFGYFDRCFIANQVLAKYIFFLNFSSDETCLGFSSRKKHKEKNEVTRNLSSSVVEKFNRYEMIRQDLARKERADVAPVDIVYEPTYDENILGLCFFASQIHLA